MQIEEMKLDNYSGKQISLQIHVKLKVIPPNENMQFLEVVVMCPRFDKISNRLYNGQSNMHTPNKCYELFISRYMNTDSSRNKKTKQTFLFLASGILFKKASCCS